MVGAEFLRPGFTEIGFLASCVAELGHGNEFPVASAFPLAAGFFDGAIPPQAPVADLAVHWWAVLRDRL